MTTERRICAVLGGLGVLAILTMLTILPRVQLAAKEIDVGENEYFNAVQLQSNRKAQQVMNAADQLIKEEEWGQAAKALQSLLDTPDDAFVQVTRPGPDGKPIQVQVSIRSEANRLLGSMPGEGLVFYEVSYGPLARALLNEAAAKNDPQLYAEVARRFLHTEAGAEAVTVLGTRFLDRNEPLHASLYFEKLMDRPGFDKMPVWTLLKAALAFHRAGDEIRRDKVMKLLQDRTRRDGGMRIGNQVVALDVLRQEMDRVFKPAPASVSDYPLFRGSASRTALGEGSPPYMDRSWLRSLFSQETDARKWTENSLKNAIRYLSEQRGQPILSAFFPVAVNGKVVYRSYDGIHATNLRLHRDSSGREYPPGSTMWKHETDGGLSSAGVYASDKRGYLEQWQANYLQYGPQGILFENSVIGTLSSDGQRVFFIDDMAMPPHPMLLRNAMWGNMPNFGALRDHVARNSLKCINLETGKLVWELSGRFNMIPDFQDTFFLGAPLPLGGKLYVLNEKNSELRLVCLECKDEIQNARPPIVVWTQTLANVRDKLQFDLNRRIHASHLAYGDGILVCPTNAGVVMGVNLMSHSLEWAHSYREASDEPQVVGPPNGRFRPQQMQQMPNTVEWKTAAPAIADGKVVFTAPDAAAMHCLNLRDGRLLWKFNRTPDDYYFAGIFAGKVLVVGKNYCRLLNLDTGKETKRIDGTGIPTGQGTASENVYYLPTRVGSDREPEVCAINLETGAIVAHTKSRTREEPGNLIFHDGEVVSQTVEHITSYPQLYARLRVIDEGIKKDPKNPVALIARGELRLDKGDLAGAYEDLHTAMANQPPADLVPKARQKLYDTLTELLHRDFPKYESRLEEYRDLCRSDQPEEQLRRQGNYLCLVGKGREQQGRLVEAFEAYMEFGALGNNEELVSVSDDPSIRSRPDVWARGRISAMLARATPEQRQPLEDLIRTRWERIKDSNDIDQLRGFVRVFGSTFGVGREARLRLAEQLIAQASDPKADELREAQLHLLQLRSLRSSEPQLAGRAVEALARLMEKKAQAPGQQNLMEHAAHYYRELGRDYAAITIRDGKTGADFFNEFITDKRFLPYLEESRQSWRGNFRGEPRTGNFPIRPTFTLEPAGDALPFFRHHRLALDSQLGQLRVISESKGQDTWQLGGLGGLEYLTQGGHTNFRSVYHVQGHVVVAQLGHMVYAFDPIDQKKLWEYNLFSPGSDASTKPKLAQVLRDRDGNLQLLYQDNWTQKLGGTGPVQASYVCLQSRDNALLALDPLTGTVLWTKADVGPRTSYFGDAEHVYLIETNESGQSTGIGKAIRAVDGSPAGVVDFAKDFDQRQAILGRHLLVREDRPDSVRLRLYDVAAGKDVWQSVLPSGAVVFKSEEERLAGGVAPDGTLAVFDLVTQQEVLRTNVCTENKERTRQTISQEDLARVHEAYLLADRDSYYVVLNKKDDQKAGSGVFMSVYPGIRSIPVNGTVVAYDRGSGQRRWVDDIENQMLVLEQFDTLPVLFFTARHNQWFQNGANRFAQQVVSVRVIAKSSGKLAFRHEFQQNANQFHAIKADPNQGIIEMASFNTMVRLTLDRPDAQQSARAELPESSPVPVPQPVRVVPGVQARPVQIRIQAAPPPAPPR